MNKTQVHDLLTVIKRADNRNFDDATVLWWHQILGDLPFDDAVEAARRHFRASREYLIPVHIVEGVAEIQRERARRQREIERAETVEADRALTAAGVRDRSVDVRQLVDRCGIPPGRPDVFRRPEWVDAERERAWASRPAVPNPAYQGPPPPGGWPIPAQSDVDDGSEQA